MNKDKAKGQGKQAKGKAKEAAGKAVGNEELEGKGKAEKGTGKVQDKYGEAKCSGQIVADTPDKPHWRPGGVSDEQEEDPAELQPAIQEDGCGHASGRGLHPDYSRQAAK